MTKVFVIHESNKALAEKNIEQLNKKFAKHNIPTISYSYSEKNEFDCFNLTVDYCDVPTISGVEYKYLGLISEEDGSKFYNGFEDRTNFEHIRNMECTCDMCKKQITNRTSFFVFKNMSNNEIKMFGSSCAKKAFPFDIGFYLNGLDMLFNDFGELIEDDGFFDENGGCFGGKRYFPIDRLISVLADVSSDFTVWTSQEKAEMNRPQMSTKEQVIDILTSKM